MAKIKLSIDSQDGNNDVISVDTETGQGIEYNDYGVIVTISAVPKILKIFPWTAIRTVMETTND